MYRTLFRAGWLTAFAALLLGAAERPQVPPKLTLQRAVEIALRQSPLVRQAAGRVRQAEASRDLLRAARLPQVSVTAFEAVRTVNLDAQGIQIPAIPGLGRPLPERVGPFSQFDARALLVQEVLSFPSHYRQRAGRTRLEASQAEGRNTRELLTLRVVLAYTEALRDQALEATLRQQLSLARQLYTITTDRQQQGVTSSLEVKRSLQQVNNLQQALYEAEQALTADKLGLANLLHAKISADYELADIEAFYDTRPPDQAATLTAALRARPDYQAAQAQVRAAELEVRGARAERYPTVTFAADYGQSGRRTFHNLNTYRIQGSLQIPVYLGGALAAKADEAEGRLAEAEAFRDEIEARVETDVLTALAAVDSARRQVEVAAETIALAREELDLSTARFVQGVSDNTEVVNAQDRLARAEQNRIRALFNLNAARANLYRSVGAAETIYRQ